jgi:hypothetical protein
MPPGRYDPHRQARRHYRRLLRLARLAFPAIRIDQTRLVTDVRSGIYVLAIFPKVNEEIFFQDGTFPSLPVMPAHLELRLRLRPWVYWGRRRVCTLTLAYEPTQDVCVIEPESVRVWPVAAMPLLPELYESPRMSSEEPPLLSVEKRICASFSLD